ncbi:D-amino acid aminotransferase [Candidatus Bathyarchaeota archaeon]|nr:D-amino acid aminotransferase [Candidatus Bathyarchaeota archaeon]
MSTVYLNGQFQPIESATISVLDRGFLFGDGVYEVIPVYGGRPFRLDEHLQRLENSLAEVRIPNPHQRDGWSKILSELIHKNEGGDQSLYLQVTRGVAPRDHHFPELTNPTLFMMSNPLTGTPTSILQHGIAAVTETDSRWSRCNIKSINLLANVLHRQHALDRGAKESILIRQGEVTEGAASNVFVVLEGTILTPPKSHYLLPGVTRDLALELAQQQGLHPQESAISEQQLAAAEEIWVTSSTKEVVPVTQLNHAPVGEGIPGLVTLQIHRHLQTFKQQFRAESPSPAH